MNLLDYFEFDMLSSSLIGYCIQEGLVYCVRTDSGSMEVRIKPLTQEHLSDWCVKMVKRCFPEWENFVYNELEQLSYLLTKLNKKIRQ